MLARSRSRLAGAADDSGYALLVVLGIFAVAMLVTALLAAQVLSTLKATSGSRASLQAEANAEAAVSRGQSTLVYPGSINDACNPSTGLRTADSAAGFKYEETLYWSSSATEPTTDSQWTVIGCNDSIGFSASDTVNAANVKFVRILATGHAVNVGASGYNAWDDRRVDAVYTYAGYRDQAVFSAGSVTGVNGNVTINIPDGSTIYVNGTFGCGGTSQTLTINSNVFSSGNAGVGGNCLINGYLESKMTASVSGSGVVTIPPPISNSTLPFPTVPLPYVYLPAGFIAGSSACANLTTSVTAATYFDLSLCNPANNISLALSNDVVLYLRNPITGNPTQGLNITSADGLHHKVWMFMIDGPAAATIPTCQGGNKHFKFSSYSVDANVSTLIYNPCQPVQFPSTTVINGSLVTNGLSVNGGDTLTVNFQNMLTPGVTSGGPAQANLTPVSYRNTR